MELGRVNKLVLLVREGCGHCAKAKTIVDELVESGVIRSDECTLIDVGKGTPENRRVFTEAFATVPQVFVNGKHVPGGSSNFERIYLNKELHSMLR